jgi:hypothetical protein
MLWKPAAFFTDHAKRLMTVVSRLAHATVAFVVGALPAHHARAFILSPPFARKARAKSAIRYLLGRFFGSSPGALALTCVIRRDSALPKLPLPKGR